MEWDAFWSCTTLSVSCAAADILADNNNAKVQKVTEKGEHMRLHAGLKSRKAY